MGNKTIVKVRYIKHGILSPQEYTYFAEDRLEVGQVVEVPVRDTVAQAQVTAVNVPDSEIEAFRAAVKTITKSPEPIKEPEKLGDFLDELPDLPNVAIEEISYTAIIKINPNKDQALVQLRGEIGKLAYYARARVIASDSDLMPLTDDLALIAGIKKSLKALQDEYVKPVKNHLADINAVFSNVMAELEEADSINRNKLTVYRTEQLRHQQEAEEINRKKLELARQEAEFNGTGEITIDTTPVEAPAPVKRVSSMAGSVSTTNIWKWELQDMGKVPAEYLIIDAAKITKVVKAGLRNIPGIRIYCEESLRVTTK